MALAKDITGQRFGRLTAIKFAFRRSYGQYWLFKCDCGTVKAIYKSHVGRGDIRSCGCLQAETRSKGNVIHGLRGTPEYIIWSAMKRRCYTKSDTNYRFYGARGITVCKRWRDSVENFLADMGRRPTPKHSIDRTDTNGNYTPENCRWIPLKEQAHNTRSNVNIVYNGRKLCQAQWARELGVFPARIQKLRKKGLTFPEIYHKLTKEKVCQ